MADFPGDVYSHIAMLVGRHLAYQTADALVHRDLCSTKVHRIAGITTFFQTESELFYSLDRDEWYTRELRAWLEAGDRGVTNRVPCCHLQITADQRIYATAPWEDRISPGGPTSGFSLTTPRGDPQEIADPETNVVGNFIYATKGNSIFRIGPGEKEEMLFDASPEDAPIPFMEVGTTLYVHQRGKTTRIEAIQKGKRRTVYTRPGESDCHMANSRGAVVCEDGKLVQIPFTTGKRQELWPHGMHPNVSLSEDGGIAWETESVIHVRRPKCP